LYGTTLISVLNESELYATWLPNWTVPRFRVRRSVKLSQSGRCSQVVLVTCDLPWPFSPRECVLDACGVDDIDHSGDIAVLVRSLDGLDDDDDDDEREENDDDDAAAKASKRKTKKRAEGEFEAPPPDDKSVVRIGFHGGFLFRALPPGWKTYKRAKKDKKKDTKRASASLDASSGETDEGTDGGGWGWGMGSWGLGGGGDANDGGDGDDDVEPEITPGHLDDPDAEALLHAAEEDVLSNARAPAAAGDDGDGDGAGDGDGDAGGKKQLLVSVQMFIDPKLDYVPSSLMNFVVRTVTYTMWCMLLRVAEGIRDGKMPEHQTAIESKARPGRAFGPARARAVPPRSLFFPRRVASRRVSLRPPLAGFDLAARHAATPTDAPPRSAPTYVTSLRMYG
jgi:hypothetical protein